MTVTGKSKQLRVAVAGAGYFSQFHYDAWQRLEAVNLVAACEPDEQRRTEVGKTYAIDKLYSNVEQMLAEEKPDLLDIVTPPHTHYAIVKAAIDANVHVICQKPLAPTLEEASQLADLTSGANTIAVAHENFRFMPWYRHLDRMIKDDQFGELYTISFRLRPGDGQGADAYLARQPYFQQMERFLLHETGIHLIDTFRFLLGDMSTVYADLRRLNPVIAGEDAGHVLFGFESGARGLFDGNRLNDHSAENCRLTMGELHLEGAHGVARLDGNAGLWWKPHQNQEERISYNWRNHGFGGDCVYTLQEHVVNHLLHDAPLENRIEDYIVNLQIQEAAYVSAESGRRLTL